MIILIQSEYNILYWVLMEILDLLSESEYKRWEGENIGPKSRFAHDIQVCYSPKMLKMFSKKQP